MINEEIIKINGFHNTEKINAIDIIKNNFIPEHRRTHYLGQGTYFFDDLELAMENKNMLSDSDNMVIISTEIEVPYIHYLNLDNRINQTKFRIYCNEVNAILGKEGLELLYKPNEGDDKKIDKKIDKIIIFRCYCLDLYKTENNYYVITKTFAKDNPSYGVKINNFDFFGFPYLEKYICVSDNSFIKSKRIVEQEWFI
jgi:hypothetical protein